MPLPTVRPGKFSKIFPVGASRRRDPNTWKPDEPSKADVWRPADGRARGHDPVGAHAEVQRPQDWLRASISLKSTSGCERYLFSYVSTVTS